jgi:ribonuclease III
MELEQKLSYVFRDKSLLSEACRHSSYVNEHPLKNLRDNERLEFLGDAVLNLVVGHLLMNEYPDLPEGELSRMRANLVNETQLADIAKSIELGDFLQLGKGEIQTQGREKNSILADAFEAVIAAIYLDGGFQAAYSMIRNHFEPFVRSDVVPRTNQDYKSQLQELVQFSHKTMPTYQVIRESGPDHDKTFVSQIDVCGIQAFGTGKSKKTAEQDAARNALRLIPKHETP